jgi:hypothetical protein
LAPLLSDHLATGLSLPYINRRDEQRREAEPMKYVWPWIVMATVAAILITSFAE